MNTKKPKLIWSGVQSLGNGAKWRPNTLDCCWSGVANVSEGNGITELLCACPFDGRANGVGHYSFTQALTIELRLLSKEPCFSIGRLYTAIYTRMQSFLMQGIANERYPPPVHFVISQDGPLARGIPARDHEAKSYRVPREEYFTQHKEKSGGTHPQ